MEVHLSLSGLGKDEESDEEMETPHKIRKFPLPYIRGTFFVRMSFGILGSKIVEWW